jgi:acetoin utilization deacetylase AcuC-like enzyme
VARGWRAAPGPRPVASAATLAQPTIDVFWHPAVLDHDTGSGVFEAFDEGLIDTPELHPENAERVGNMHAVLERGPLAARLRWREGREASEHELAVLHDPDYIASLRRTCESGGGRFSSTTIVSPASWKPMLAAAGTSLEAARAVLDGETQAAYALVRPPGHHAAPAMTDGYCFFNNAGLAAQLARDRGVPRVAIVDWDVHHGNGTQTCFYNRSDVLTISLHMRHGSWGPSHPETGAPDELGEGAGSGYNINLELRPGSGDGAYLAAFEQVVLPALRQFQPGLIVAGCGQDASAFDPNGRQNVTMGGFRAIGATMGRAADELCDGRLVLVQEGGYARTYAAYCLHATLEGVLGTGPLLDDPLAYMPDDPEHAAADLELIRSHVGRHWELG